MIITTPLVIFMIIVFVPVFLFINTIDKRKWLTTLISIVITPLVYFYVFYPMINIFNNYHHQKHFNTANWIENPDLRYEMVDDLLDNKNLFGKSKEEVEKKLGNFEWFSFDDSLKIKDPNKWNYGLGIEPGAFNGNKEMLLITFKNDSAVTVKHYQEQITFNDKE